MATLAGLEGVPSAYAATRDGIDVLLRDRGLRKTPPAFTSESLLRGAAASAALEGSGSSPEQIRAGEGDETAAAAVRLSAEALSLVPTLRQAPLQAFARLHAIAAKGVLGMQELGRPRDADSAERLRVLATRISQQTSAPAMVVAALVHAEIATAAPFASHNGLVARAAERLVLVGRGSMRSRCWCPSRRTSNCVRSTSPTCAPTHLPPVSAVSTPGCSTVPRPMRSRANCPRCVTEYRHCVTFLHAWCVWLRPTSDKFPARAGNPRSAGRGKRPPDCSEGRR